MCSSGVEEAALEPLSLHRPSWMRDCAAVLGSFSLTQVCLPGAHNAGTDKVRSGSGYGYDAPGLLRKMGFVGKVARTFAGSTTARWARCQDMSIFAQLEYGIRYFDIRLAPNPKADNELYVTHSLFSDSLTAVMDDVYAFSKSTNGSGEFIILDFQSIFVDTDGELEDKFYSRISSIADCCVPNNVPLSTSLRDLVARSPVERIFVLADRAFALETRRKVLPRRRFLQSEWKDKRGIGRLLRAFDADLLAACTEADASPPARFNVTQGVLTPAASEIVRGALLCYKPSLKHLAGSANARVLQWFHDWNTTSTVNGSLLPVKEGLYRNILMIDFVHEGRIAIAGSGAEKALWYVDIVDLCIYLNRQRVSQ